MTDTAPRPSAILERGAGAPAAVAVLGAGTMGRGIAQLAAQSGLRVRVFDPDSAALERARIALGEVFAMLHRKGRLSEPPATVSERLTYHGRLDELAGVDWVLEAAPEELALKRALFRDVATTCPDARLATNTSTLSVTEIATATDRPGDLIGIHFFNPAPLMRLVEIVPGAGTEPATIAAALDLARKLGRSPVVAQDRPGFIVNRVARPFYGEALRLAGEGIPYATIDLALRSAGFRMGPFELLDLIGLDINLAATKSVYQAFFQEPRYRPHPMQQAMVTAGRLGRKTGRGFYHYGDDGPPPPARPVPPVASPDAAPVLVLGDGHVARWLQHHLLTTRNARDAALVLDARIALESKLPLPESDGRPLATLCWGHSASRAVGRYARALVGFSLLAPQGGGEPDDAAAPLVELLAPEGANPVLLEPVRRVLAEHGLATLDVPDRAGGVSFRTLALLVNEAASALSEGLATAEAIDHAMVLGAGYPRGPLTWAAALGLEDVELALRGLHQELGAERFAPQPLLTRLAAVGAPSFPGRT